MPRGNQARWLFQTILPLLLTLGAAAAPQELASPLHSYLELPAAERKPDFFEPFLITHPTERFHREAALVYYSRTQRNPDLLKRHTRILAATHPESYSIRNENVTLFYAEPSYREEIIQILEQQTQAGVQKAVAFLTLADLYRMSAVSPYSEETGERERFHRYFELPPDAPLTTETNLAAAELAIKNYRRALSSPDVGVVELTIAADRLAALLTKLGRAREAAPVCANALRRIDRMQFADVVRADLLLRYGYTLHELGRTAEAAATLHRVRASDNEWQQGPGHATMRAEMELGLIALEKQDVPAACRHLLASCSVRPCEHTITQPFPIKLARRLLEAGREDVVRKFVRRALERFNPDQPDLKALLPKASPK